jgi:hypothetical protein
LFWILSGENALLQIERIASTRHLGRPAPGIACRRLFARRRWSLPTPGFGRFLFHGVNDQTGVPLSPNGNAGKASPVPWVAQVLL